MNALLIVDVQHDFLPGGALAVNEGDSILPVINTLQPLFDIVVATQDWHPAGHKSFASSHANKSPFEEIEINGLPQTLWPDHCVAGSEGAKLSVKLNEEHIVAIFRKGTLLEIDSYSAFYDNGRGRSTALAEYLKGLGVQQLFVVGLAADYCVYYSIMDAISEGFDVSLILDATKAIDINQFKVVCADIEHRGGHLIHSTSLKL